MPVAPEYLHLVYPGTQFEALLYGRNSHDPSGKGRSVESQLFEGRELCDQHGWPIKAVFDKDVGKSASRHAKERRDDFEALLEAIRAGEGNIVVAFEASRYYRDLEAYVRLRNACFEAGCLLCYNGEVYDLSKRSDRKATARDALDAEDEAEGIQNRNARTQRRLVAEGWPAGRTPYGYRRRYSETTGELLRQEPHPVRALFVQDMFRRFLGDGDTPAQTTYAIAQWLNTEPAAAHRSGRKWDAAGVTIQLRLLANAGRRVHKGQDAGPGQWDALVDLETFQRAQALLDEPGRRTQESTTVVHLLSWIPSCGMHPEEESWLKAGKRNGKPTYVCERGDTSITAARLDAYVEEAALRWWQSPQAMAAFRRDEDTAKADRAQRLLTALEAQLEEARTLAGTFGDDGAARLSALSLARLEKSLEPQIAKARGEATAQLGVPRALLQLVGRRDVEEVWADMAPADRRRLMGRSDPGKAWAALDTPRKRRLVGWPDVEEVWNAMTILEKRAALRASVRIRLFPAHVRGAQTIRPGRVRLDFQGSPEWRPYVPGRRQTPA